MNYLSILLYIFSLCFAFLSIYISFKMYKKYQLRYLATYLYFLITFNVLGFLNLIGRHLLLGVLSDQPRQVMMEVIYLFAFLTFPFVVLSIYLFFYLMRGLLEKEVSPAFNRFYFIIWTIIFLVQVLLTKNYFDTNDDRLLHTFFLSVNVLAIIGLCISAIYIFFKGKYLTDKNKKKAARNFGLIYVLCFVFTFTVTSKVILPRLGPFIVPFVVFLFFTLNLPALLYLRYHLNKYYIEPLLQPGIEADLQGFFSKHEISKREQDIIHLMLKGKSNTDIVDELFISLHTVKNHIYNIYQKLGVKNRLQITNLIQKYLQSKRR